MKCRPYVANPFKGLLIHLIRSTVVDAETVRRAFLSLSESDRDCMPYVAHLLRLEG